MSVYRKIEHLVVCVSHCKGNGGVGGYLRITIIIIIIILLSSPANGLSIAVT